LDECIQIFNKPGGPRNDASNTAKKYVKVSNTRKN